MPYLNVLSKFRDEIRAEARLNKRKFTLSNIYLDCWNMIWLYFVEFKETQILNVCDNLRDNVLPDIGVLIEDLGKLFFV